MKRNLRNLYLEVLRLRIEVARAEEAAARAKHTAVARIKLAKTERKK